MITTFDMLARVRAVNAERNYLLNCLELWEHVKKAGYDPDEVKTFSFRHEFLTPEEKKHYPKCENDRPLDWSEQFHNCIRLHTGELKSIPLVCRPIKPIALISDTTEASHEN